MSRAEFAGRFGSPDVTGALSGYTLEADTHAVLTLLAYARPRRVLEVGTALGHMTANSQAPEMRSSGPGPLLAAPPRGARTLPAGRPKVSLTMIVRNEEDNLPHCLASAADLFDEVIVVDTGSTDRTREIARKGGARVFDFVWVDDFAAARNAALARATGDYAFWLDADDVLDPPERQRLEGLLDGLRHGDPAAYVVRCSCDPDQNGGGGQTVVDHVRLFPLREDVRWTLGRTEAAP